MWWKRGNLKQAEMSFLEVMRGFDDLEEFKLSSIIEHCPDHCPGKVSCQLKVILHQKRMERVRAESNKLTIKFMWTKLNAYLPYSIDFV